MEDINPGDKVQLISGGPEMTVRGTVGDDSFSKDEAQYQTMVRRFKRGDIYCEWFDGNKLEQAAFRKETLKTL